MASPTRRGLLVPGILVAGLAWRLFLSFVFVPAWEARANVGAAPDSYPVLARSLVERGELGYEPYGASPTTVRGPGFPAWLGLGFIAGGENPHWLGFWGGLPGLFAGVLLALLVRRRYGELAALVAGAIAVLHPLAEPDRLARDGGRLLRGARLRGARCVVVRAWLRRRAETLALDRCGRVAARAADAQSLFRAADARRRRGRGLGGVQAPSYGFLRAVGSGRRR